MKAQVLLSGDAGSIPAPAPSLIYYPIEVSERAIMMAENKFEGRSFHLSPEGYLISGSCAFGVINSWGCDSSQNSKISVDIDWFVYEV